MRTQSSELPPMVFTDAHVHFWDPARFTYPWLARNPEICRRHVPADLDEEAIGFAPTRMIFIQAECAEDQAIDEVRWAGELAARDPRIAAFVAFGRMDGSLRSAGHVKALGEHALVRGVRHLIQGQPDPDFCIRPGFIAGVRECGHANLRFEICCVAEQLPNVIRLVEHCPGTTFILDHAGKPGIRSRQLDPWREHMEKLASFPHVVCKVSALVTQARHHDWQIDDLQPYWNHLLAVFGPGRLLFGSDWPVVKLASSYRRWLDTAAALGATLTPADRSAIFNDNATRVYGIT